MSTVLSIPITLFAAFSIGLGAAVSIWIVSSSRPQKKLPPGPPQDPIIGHLRILKPENQGDLFFNLSKVYDESI
ncbi:hypothetical protein BDQ17DRAFT_1459996 [Cyathus striatus]|nr:hypothetical protein BDQ17DRAFT_1459996 [Cyathus striatus]